MHISKIFRRNNTGILTTSNTPITQSLATCIVHKLAKFVLNNFTKYTGKRLYSSLFSNKDAGLRAAALLIYRLRHMCFSVCFAKFLRTPISIRRSVNDCFCKLKTFHSFIVFFLLKYTFA